MNLRGQTPLTQASIPDDQRRLLRSLWIESIEEALAASAAIGDFRRLRSAVEALADDFARCGLKACLRGQEAREYTTVAKMEIDITQPLEGLGQKVRTFVPGGFWAVARALSNCLRS